MTRKLARWRASADVVETYSHLNGLEFLMVHKPTLWSEIQNILEASTLVAFERKSAKGKTMIGNPPVPRLPCHQRGPLTIMAWFRNRYHCDDCGTGWKIEWSCCCDDECPVCGSRNWSPVESHDLTFLIEETGEAVVVSMSPVKPSTHLTMLTLQSL